MIQPSAIRRQRSVIGSAGASPSRLAPPSIALLFFSLAVLLPARPALKSIRCRSRGITRRSMSSMPGEYRDAERAFRRMTRHGGAGGSGAVDRFDLLPRDAGRGALSAGAECGGDCSRSIRRV